MKKALILMLVLAMLASSALAEGLTSFQTRDVNLGEGAPENITQEIFAPYDLTMIYVWSTTCYYCLRGMPSMAKLQQMLPENVNLITLCDDADTDAELVCRILEESGATTFPTLVPNDEIRTQLLNNVLYYPTTYFVDHQGNAVVKAAGSPSSENPEDVYLKWIDEALDLLEGSV